MYIYIYIHRYMCIYVYMHIHTYIWSAATGVAFDKTTDAADPRAFYY